MNNGFGKELFYFSQFCSQLSLSVSLLFFTASIWFHFFFNWFLTKGLKTLPEVRGTQKLLKVEASLLHCEKTQHCSSTYIHLSGDSITVYVLMWLRIKKFPHRMCHLNSISFIWCIDMLFWGTAVSCSKKRCGIATVNQSKSHIQCFHRLIKSIAFDSICLECIANGILLPQLKKI